MKCFKIVTFWIKSRSGLGHSKEIKARKKVTEQCYPVALYKVVL